MVVSFKTSAGAVATVHKQTYKIVCFGDAISGRLRVDTTATVEKKHDPFKYGRTSIFIYKFCMYTEASLEPERCSFKDDIKAKNHWVSTHARHIRQFEDVNIPLNIPRDGAMDENKMGENTGRANHHNHPPQAGVADTPPQGVQQQAQHRHTLPQQG